jgi:two-component system chemotaxis sensor kinase CheA
MAETDDFEAQLLTQMRADFLAESQEVLDQLAPLLVQLEQSGDRDLLQEIFRLMHTLKGTAGFVGLDHIRALAHKMEDVFGALRDGRLAVTADVIDLAFAGLQSLIAMRDQVLHGGTGETDTTPLIARLGAVLQDGGPGLETKKVSPAPQPAGEPVEEQDEAPSPMAPPAAPAQTAASPTLRVPIETLDAMMELVGELITARNTLVALAEQSRDEQLLSNAAVISRLTRELQTTVTSVRLTPVERLFNRFTGVVRNTARECGKCVRLVIEGGETPLDRAISEQMHDPLIHLLRNAVDHGLESPEERKRAGKPEEGVIRLSAERRGDDVILRVADDGGGIDPERVRRAAVERGLYTADEMEALSDDQAVHLIFTSGFSTAVQVTDLSGRGVGMDVVAQNVRRLRGGIRVETAPGQGTTFVIQLPLTLAVLQVQLVQVGGYTYALPLHIVRETLQVALEDVQTMQQGEVFFVHGAALPLRRLESWLPYSAAARAAPPCARPAVNGLKPAIVVRLTGRDEVLVVDGLVGKQQVVIKPLSPYLGAVKGVEGAAILPDGSVTLILDVEGLMS